jgi:hypothetical protein
MPYVITQPCIRSSTLIPAYASIAEHAYRPAPSRPFYAEADVPVKWKDYTQINAEYFEKQSKRVI